MKKLEKKIDMLLDSLNEDQSVFAMCANKEGNFFYSYYMSEHEIAAGVATIISDAFDDDNDVAQRAAIGIITGIAATIKHGGKSANEVMRVLAPAAADHALKSLKKLRQQIEDMNDDDDEDCESCEHNRECQLPSAVKYRKEHHIPRLKKNKKGARKVEIN